MRAMLEHMDAFRKANGYYSIEELITGIGSTNTIIDPFSVLIGKNIYLGQGNTIHPSVILHAENGSSLSIGDDNLFSSCTRIEVANNSSIIIGDRNVFYDGTVCIKCNVENGEVIIGNNCGFDGRINIFGKCFFGNGSRIIGTINVYNCVLEEGGDSTEPNPDNRAGLIKGIGTARDLKVNAGMVINGFGDFDQSKIEPQSNYHKT